VSIHCRANGVTIFTDTVTGARRALNAIAFRAAMWFIFPTKFIYAHNH
jgi:hypothetical protein